MKRNLGFCLMCGAAAAMTISGCRVGGRPPGGTAPRDAMARSPAAAIARAPAARSVAPGMSPMPGAAATRGVARLLDEALAADGPAYLALRKRFLALAGGATAIARIARGASDWRRRVLARAWLGWRRHPAEYAKLWVYRPPWNRYRNPYPRMMADARHRFISSGRRAIPIMLELLLKRRESHRGALYFALGKWRDPGALPVMSDYLASGAPAWEGVGYLVGRFGRAATPHLLAALRAPRGDRRALLMLLGLTADPGLVPRLRREHAGAKNADHRVSAAWALGRLKEFAYLRRALGSAKGREERRVIIGALAGDRTAATGALLEGLVNGPDRLAAIHALSARGYEPFRKRLCRVAQATVSTYDRKQAYWYLISFGSKTSPVVQGCLLACLADRAAKVRDECLRGLSTYRSPAVTKVVLRFARPGHPHRAVALGAVYDRRTPSVVAAARRLLFDPDSHVQAVAANILRMNPSAHDLARLVRLLARGSVDGRVGAARALGALKSPAAKTALEAALRAEKNRWVRQTILETLTPAPGRRPKPKPTPRPGP